MIDLEPYITDLRKNIIFFDILLNISDCKKEATLLDKNIEPRTFRRLKQNVTPSTPKVIEILNESFGINVIDNSKIGVYNDILNDIVKKIYYKVPYNHKHYLEIIQEFINTNNLLQPIFKLFRMILIMNDITLYRDDVLKLISEDLKYTKNFIDYFNDELKEIFNYCFIYCEEQEEEFSENIVSGTERNSFSFFNTLTMFLLSGKHFAAKNYSMALVFALECEKNLIMSENQNRLNSVRCNICACYNKVALYNLTNRYAEKLYYTMDIFTMDKAFVQKVLLNYGFSLLMTNNFLVMEKIFSSSHILNYENNLGKMYYVISLYKQLKYDDVLQFHDKWEGFIDNGYAKIIKFIVSIIKKEPSEFNFSGFSEILIQVYRKLLKEK